MFLFLVLVLVLVLASPRFTRTFFLRLCLCLRERWEQKYFFKIFLCLKNARCLWYSEWYPTKPILQPPPLPHPVSTWEQRGGDYRFGRSLGGRGVYYAYRVALEQLVACSTNSSFTIRAFALFRGPSTVSYCINMVIRTLVPVTLGKAHGFHNHHPFFRT